MWRPIWLSSSTDHPAPACIPGPWPGFIELLKILQITDQAGATTADVVDIGFTGLKDKDMPAVLQIDAWRRPPNGLWCSRS